MLNNSGEFQVKSYAQFSMGNSATTTDNIDSQTADKKNRQNAIIPPIGNIPKFGKRSNGKK